MNGKMTLIVAKSEVE